MPDYGCDGRRRSFGSMNLATPVRGVDPALLQHQIESRQAVVGVVGMGYVGQPLAIAAHQKGFRVIGFDTDLAK
ncbi:MAG: nucleotide sugar dehydrogenase, partial [Rhizomicrobium sp.]